jgi:hypothetical protein
MALELNAWIASLVDAVELNGPQRLEVESKTPLMVVSLEMFRALSGHRPSFTDMLDGMSVPESEWPGAQTPFNTADGPVPYKA